jgi:hypothetical protein
MVALVKAGGPGTNGRRVDVLPRTAILFFHCDQLAGRVKQTVEPNVQKSDNTNIRIWQTLVRGSLVAMPIKFRCVYCEQLLGIARRKAGTVVKCPNCEGQLIVPAPDPDDVLPEEKDEETEAAPRKEGGAAKMIPAPAAKATGLADDTAGGMLFEQDNFDELLKPAVEKRPKPAPKPSPAQTFDLSDMPELSAPVAEAIPVVAEAPVHQPAPQIAAPLPAKQPRSGVLLTPIKIVLLLFFILFVGAGSFVGGVFAGRLLLK